MGQVKNCNPHPDNCSPLGGLALLVNYSYKVTIEFAYVQSNACTQFKLQENMRMCVSFHAMYMKTAVNLERQTRFFDAHLSTL